MANYLERLQKPTSNRRDDPGVFVVGSDEADPVLDAIGSETSRRIVGALLQQPATSSELAERADTSVQNVHYHLSRLTEAGVVEPIDERYSEKGYEMVVYAPVHNPMVFVGDDEQRTGIERSLTDLVAGVGLLLVGSLAVQLGASALAGKRIGSGVIDPASIGQPGGAMFTGLFDLVEPGVVFFVGSLLVLLVLAIRNRRR